MTSAIQLRAVLPEDLPIFFAQQLDPEANVMAAFTAKDPADRAAFNAHWQRILADETITMRTLEVDAGVAGYLASFRQFGQPSVSYWIGREYWGRGIATTALTEFVQQVGVRPLYARAAKDNVASLRVLEKCGFEVVGEDKGFAHARNAEVEEFLLRLE